MDWQEHYRSRTVSPGEAVSHIKTDDIVAIPKKIDHLAASKRLNPDLLCVRSDVIENNPTGTLRDEDRSRIGISGQMTLSQAVSIGGERNTDCG